jgi:methyl-accepting chemotaxis protein
MSPSSLRWPALPSAAALLAAWTGVREYFAYHGAWAPGVRLLRRMTVRGKLALVIGIAAAPMPPMTVQIAMDQNRLVESTRQQLAELHLSGAVAELAGSLNAAVLAGNGGASFEAQLREDWARLQAAQAAAQVVGLPLQQAWERDRRPIELAAQASGLSAETRLESQMAAAEALTRFGRSVGQSEHAGHTSDRELDGASRLAIHLLPALQIELARLDVQLARLTHADRHGGSLLIPAASRLERARSLVERCEAPLRRQALSGTAGATTMATVQGYLDAAKAEVMAMAQEPGSAPPDLRPDYVQARDALQKLRAAQFDSAERGLQAQLKSAETLRLWVLCALIAAFFLSVYLLYCFYLVMRGGLQQLNQQMVRMANGDLSARPLPVGGDEVAATMQAMNASLVRLSDLMSSVRAGVSGVNQATQQVASGNAELTRRNRDNASGLNAVVDGVTRYATQLDACGRQVESVVQNVQGLRLDSERNRKQMQRLRERMAALRSKSREIGEIVTLIDGIAFRTNILALNASVEASKAGEAGRGFAVVAQEVRSLAMRGAESARRIGDIVARSTDDIELSGALAEETGQALAVADARVDGIHRAMDGVAALTLDGTQESAAILQQLTGIRDATAHSLQLVEQLASASGALRGQGERLAQKVGQFRLG